MDAAALALQTRRLRAALDLLEEQLQAAQAALDAIETAAGLVDPETGARADE